MRPSQKRSLSVPEARAQNRDEACTLRIFMGCASCSLKTEIFMSGVTRRHMRSGLGRRDKFGGLVARRRSPRIAQAPQMAEQGQRLQCTDETILSPSCLFFLRIPLIQVLKFFFRFPGCCSEPSALLSTVTFPIRIIVCSPLTFPTSFPVPGLGPRVGFDNFSCDTGWLRESTSASLSVAFDRD
jgi:hypothetical protein